MAVHLARSRAEGGGNAVRFLIPPGQVVFLTMP
jgi:hypothetical protein